MPIQTVQRRRLYQQIAEQIKQLIHSGEYPPGSMLPAERELASLLGVSRTTVREALIALEIEQYVHVHVGNGVEVIRNPSEVHHQSSLPTGVWEKDAELIGVDDLQLDFNKEVPPFSLLQTRRLIEPEAAALAAQHATREQLDDIRQAYLRNIEDNRSGSHTHPGDRLFHIRIADASGNPAFSMILRFLLAHKYGPLFTQLQSIYTPAEMPAWSEVHHRQIFEALMSHDAEAAREAMAYHLDMVIDIFLQE